MDAEQFIQIHALKTMTGALAATVIDLSPEALAQALALGDRGLTRTTSVELRRLDDTPPLFEVTYREGPRAVRLRATLRETGPGEWTIARLERVRRR